MNRKLVGTALQPAFFITISLDISINLLCRRTLIAAWRTAKPVDRI
jgi:hypothetical protein